MIPPTRKRSAESDPEIGPPVKKVCVEGPSPADGDPHNASMIDALHQVRDRLVAFLHPVDMVNIASTCRGARKVFDNETIATASLRYIEDFETRGAIRSAESLRLDNTPAIDRFSAIKTVLPCRVDGCRFYGTRNTGWKCTKCGVVGSGPSVRSEPLVLDKKYRDRVVATYVTEISDRLHAQGIADWTFSDYLELMLWASGCRYICQPGTYSVFEDIRTALHRLLGKGTTRCCNAVACTLTAAICLRAGTGGRGIVSEYDIQAVDDGSDGCAAMRILNPLLHSSDEFHRVLVETREMLTPLGDMDFETFDLVFKSCEHMVEYVRDIERLVGRFGVAFYARDQVTRL